MTKSLCLEVRAVSQSDLKTLITRISQIGYRSLNALTTASMAWKSLASSKLRSSDREVFAS